MTHSTSPARQASAPFRQHDVVSVSWASALLRQLCEEWVELNHSPELAHIAVQWDLPAGLDTNCLGAIVDGIDKAAGPIKDRAIHALLQLHRGGDQLAGRVLLQAMLPCLVDLAGRSRAPRSEATFEDQAQRAVTEFWAVISLDRALPIKGVAGRLWLDTVNRCTSHRRSRDAWEEHTWFYPDTQSGEEAGERVSGQIGREVVAKESAETAQQLSAATGELNPDGDLAQLLSWARAEDVLSDDQVALLTEVYLRDDRNLKESALRLGLPHTALRKRISRIRQSLVDAVRAEAAA